MIELLGSALISGYLTFWSRPCDLTAPCPLPEALAPSSAIEAELESPSKPQTATHFKSAFESEYIQGDFEIFWNYKSPEITYIVSQITLFDKNTKRPLNQCTSYLNMADAFPFPVGSCSGFIRNEKGETVQVGISFSRLQLAK